MKFCPRCGSICLPTKEGDKTIFKCSCGHQEEGEGKIVEKVKHETKEIEVVDKEIETHPLTEATCPRCKHGKAYFWEIQTRAGDEAATAFFKCEKCKHTWREYK